MNYHKPELILMGDANQVVQTALTKGSMPFDNIVGEPVLTNAAAYQADE